MTAFQAPQIPPARPRPEAKPETADAQPLPPDAEANRQGVTPEPAAEQPRLTGEDMSGWAMGGSD